MAGVEAALLVWSVEGWRDPSCASKRHHPPHGLCPRHRVYALLQTRAPKTRGSAARHQAARIDPDDVVQLLTAVFGRVPSTQRLWPFTEPLEEGFKCSRSLWAFPRSNWGTRPPTIWPLCARAAQHFCCSCLKKAAWQVAFVSCHGDLSSRSLCGDF